VLRGSGQARLVGNPQDGWAVAVLVVAQPEWVLRRVFLRDFLRLLPRFSAGDKLVLVARTVVTVVIRHNVLRIGRLHGFAPFELVSSGPRARPIASAPVGASAVG